MTDPKLSRYFFSTLGGIAMFGPMGFIVGPLVAALFLALLDIYSAEFLGRHPALPELEPPPDPPGVETPG
jgi:predicted PurR-regulated permease PerM